jgi:two-component system LytT family response regulator
MKALIVEDEPLAAENLRFYLKEYPLEIIGVAGNIQDAVRLIKKNKPGVIFLDINLSGENGFDLLDRIDITSKVIFVTAYDEYAVRAFEVNALDYILKPLKRERIAKAVTRLLHSQKNGPSGRFTIDDTIFLSTGMRACFIKVKDVRYLQADSSYSKIFIDDQVYKSSARTLKSWEKILPEKDFIRIHRSFIINMNYADEIHKHKNGMYKVALHRIQKPLEISRRFASSIKSRLGI